MEIRANNYWDAERIRDEFKDTHSVLIIPEEFYTRPHTVIVQEKE